jgi:SNF2 family DNA or RNA helicase
MLNFRKLKQDYSSAIVKEGRDLFENQKVLSAKILHLDSKIMRVTGKIVGQYENAYESEIEIDRQECEAIDSDCDCPHNFDCHHLTALLFYLEHNIDSILVAYSKENDLKDSAAEEHFNEEERQELLEKLKKAQSKEVQRQEELYQKQVLQEYISSSELLALSPFFRADEVVEIDKADFGLIFALPANQEGEVRGSVEVQIVLRLPFRSKPLYVLQVKEFIEALRYKEQIALGGKRYSLTVESFEPPQQEIVKMVMDHAYFLENQNTERSARVALISAEMFGTVLAKAYEMAVETLGTGYPLSDDDLPYLSGFYEGNLENQLRFCPHHAGLRFALEYIPPPTSKLLLKPMILAHQEVIEIAHSRLFECSKPGMLYRSIYSRFATHITRLHMRNLRPLRDMTIPEPLFGAFVENSLPALTRFSQIANEDVIEHFVTLPYVKNIEATCELTYLNGELDATLCFHYDKHRIPVAPNQLTYEQVASFVQPQGILARNLVEERKIIDDLFQDFIFNPSLGNYTAKSEKKIVEFMTDVIPRNQGRVHFNCPQNLLDQFIYDQTTFKMHLKHTAKIDTYEIELKVDGALRGVRLDLLWECLVSKKSFIELETSKFKAKKGAETGKMPKILVLDLDRLAGVVQAFDELGIVHLEDHKLERPLWSLASIDASNFASLPVEFSITDKLVDIRKQMLGEKSFSFSPVPSVVKATLRTYQTEGVHWLERLRLMYLNGILADDMGLGKTLQAIVAITQNCRAKTACSLIVCPTSLLYNWKEEFSKFNPKLKVLVIDGIPNVRKKMIDNVKDFDVVITSYTLLQKDIESYKPVAFAYVILDEAQHIKNRGTRNAKSVKMVQAEHKLILSGTPIENSLDELWSLFDFLMPGFLSTYDRFVEKYVRVSGAEQTKNLEYLRRKVSPFILRRMKSDVLDDLPPVSEIVYHCQLSAVQLELYRSYAESARSELTKLVQKEGFDKVQIHVLATLTRLKQICCHPAIFAKETAEPGDSSKYEMLQDLVQTLVEGKHKTVIFSQYTRMLQIMRVDLEKRGIRFLYLDGSSKNRLEVVKQFNDDEAISVFLVSLKAGGTGLNLVGADTVIHYDMWWNPAVENQATDRVHRMGQKQSVSAYKLITLGTIEEKIAEMQKRKKGLVKKVVSCDDEAISKLTWEDVLELLKT